MTTLLDSAYMIKLHKKTAAFILHDKTAVFSLHDKTAAMWAVFTGPRRFSNASCHCCTLFDATFTDMTWLWPHNAALHSLSLLRVYLSLLRVLSLLCVYLTCHCCVCTVIAIRIPVTAVCSVIAMCIPGALTMNRDYGRPGLNQSS